MKAEAVIRYRICFDLIDCLAESNSNNFQADSGSTGGDSAPLTSTGPGCSYSFEHAIPGGLKSRLPKGGEGRETANFKTDPSREPLIEPQPVIKTLNLLTSLLSLLV